MMLTRRHKMLTLHSISLSKKKKKSFKHYWRTAAKKSQLNSNRIVVRKKKGNFWTKTDSIVPKLHSSFCM
jgi:hypothetical protein